MSDKLTDLCKELGKTFGKLTRWKLVCMQNNAVSDEDKVKLAEQVLQEDSTGTIVEWLMWHLKLLI